MHLGRCDHQYYVHFLAWRIDVTMMCLLAYDNLELIARQWTD